MVRHMLKGLFQRREQLPTQVRDVARDAADSLFTSMFGERPAPELRLEGEELANGVVGVISFAGDVSYSFALILPEKTAPKLAMDFAGMELTIDDPNMLYVVGELANLIAGDLVARMEANQINTRMSLPALSRGPDVLRSLSMGREVIDMVFTLPQGDVVCKLASAPSFEYVEWPGQ
jgi:chemotaxis protein CheX